MASEQAILHVVAVLCEAFGRKPSPMTYEAYGMALSDLPDKAVRDAAGRAVREAKFMPTPAELRQAAGVLSHDDRALQAWLTVEQSLSLGPYRHVDFADRAINAAIRSLGGWPTFLARLTDAEAEKWARTDFLKSYASLARAGFGDEQGAPLEGLAEAEIRDGKRVLPVPSRIACDTTSQERLGSAPRKPLLQRAANG